MTQIEPICQRPNAPRNIGSAREALANVRRQLAEQNIELAAATAAFAENRDSNLDIDPAELRDFQEATEPRAPIAAPPLLGCRC